MSYYLFQRRLLIAVLALYFIVGNFTWGVSRIEIYPIFSWELFSLVPNLEVDYGIKVHSINNVPLESSTYFQELPDEFAEAQSVIALFVIEDLGEAIEENDEEAIADYRHQIESVFLSDKQSVEYSVVKRAYYPIRRWETGLFEEETILNDFAK